MSMVESIGRALVAVITLFLLAAPVWSYAGCPTTLYESEYFYEFGQLRFQALERPMFSTAELEKYYQSLLNAPRAFQHRNSKQSGDDDVEYMSRRLGFMAAPKVLQLVIGV